MRHIGGGFHGADRREFVKIPPRRERPIPLAAHYQHRHILVARRIEHRAERLDQSAAQRIALGGATQRQRDHAILVRFRNQPACPDTLYRAPSSSEEPTYELQSLM